jgi:hypothetical protein
VQRSKGTPPTTIERFHSRKFHDKGSSVDKKAMLKVTGMSGNKRQRTPVKTVMMDALQEMVKDEMEDMARQDRLMYAEETMKEEMTATDALLISDPKILMGSSSETQQEQ